MSLPAFPELQSSQCLSPAYAAHPPQAVAVRFGYSQYHRLRLYAARNASGTGNSASVGNGEPTSVKHIWCASLYRKNEEHPIMSKEDTREDLKRTAAQPLLLSIPDVAASLGLGRSKVYELIAQEGLPVIRFGRSVRVSAASLQKWVEQREQHPRPH